MMLKRLNVNKLKALKEPPVARAEARKTAPVADGLSGPRPSAASRRRLQHRLPRATAQTSATGVNARAARDFLSGNPGA